MTPVTNPDVLSQLNGPTPVTDPAILAQLNGEQEKPKTVRDVIREAARQGGLTIRAGIQGAAAIPAMLANVPATIYNTGADLVQGEGQGYRFPDQNTALSNALTSAGLPQPKNATERTVQDVASSMAGAGSMAKAGQLMAKYAGPIVQGIGNTLSAGPGMQIVSAGTGAAGADIAKESGAGPVGQIAAGVAGSVLPSLAVASGSAAIRGIARGGKEGRQTMLDRMKTFEEAGATPSVGQATGNRAMQAVESAASKSPGGAGPMLKAAEAQNEEMAAKVNSLADKLMPGATATKAGAKIEQGVKDFVQRFRGEQNFLYDKLDKHIPSDTQISATNTKTALAELNADIPGAPNLSEWFKNSKIKGIEGALNSDAANGTLPYEALKKLRTLVGGEISNNTIASDVPRSKWKALYAALSNDLENAAKQAGPDAEKAFSRANAYSAAGYGRIENFLDRVAGKDTVEKVFQAAVNPSEIKEGASTINAVMRSLGEDQRKSVQAAFIKRMGLATAGNQNDLGEKFSAATMLTNWNKISPEAKLTLFADKDGGLRQNLTKIAEASNMIKEGSKVFANPSGTQQAISNQATIGGAGLALLTGHPLAAGAVGAAVGSANVTAKLMTNPKFVSWLAKSTNISPAMIPSALNSLAQSAKNEPQDVQDEIAKYSKSINQQLAGQKQK